MVTIQRCDDGIVQCETMHLEFFTTQRWLLARPWLLALAASLAAHAWLMQAGSSTPRSAERATPGLATVRMLNQKIPAPVALDMTAEPATARRSDRPRRPRPAVPAETPAAAPESRPESAPDSATGPAPVQAPPASVRLAAPGEWHYILLQNGQYGRARLNWQPGERDYSLLLERELDGRPLPAWKSQGQLDAQGLSPDRYVQQRRGRDMVATNFRREEGLISFSASSEEVPLPAGVQDRLSWWIQLAAMIEAAPERYPPGSELRLPVVALRGEAREWRFEVLDQQTLELPGASIARALHLRRAALGPYSGDIEVWLDPARGHIPVQLTMDLPDDRGWQMQLSAPAEKP